MAPFPRAMGVKKGDRAAPRKACSPAGFDTCLPCALSPGTMSSTNERAAGAPASTVPSASGGTFCAQGMSGTRRAPPSLVEEPDSRAPGPEQQLQPGAPPPLLPLPPARGCSPRELALDGDPRASADVRNKPRERSPGDRTSLHCRTNTSKLWPLGERGPTWTHACALKACLHASESAARSRTLPGGV